MKGNNIPRLKYFSLAPIAAKLLSIQYAKIPLSVNWLHLKNTSFCKLVAFKEYLLL